MLVAPLNNPQIYRLYLDKMLAMVMLAYVITLIVGEAIRDVQYAHIAPDEFNLLVQPPSEARKNRPLFTGYCSLILRPLDAPPRFG